MTMVLYIYAVRLFVTKKKMWCEASKGYVVFRCSKTWDVVRCL